MPSHTLPPVVCLWPSFPSRSSSHCDNTREALIPTSVLHTVQCFISPANLWHHRMVRLHGRDMVCRQPPHTHTPSSKENGCSLKWVFRRSAGRPKPSSRQSIRSHCPPQRLPLCTQPQPRWISVKSLPALGVQDSATL